MDLNCPYCQTAFPKFPSRKTKCQACGQVVYPKRRMEDPADVKVLLTEQQANEVENAWREHQAKAQLVETLKPTGISFEQLQTYSAPDAAIEDIAYHGLQHCLHEFLIDDLNARAFAYHLLGNLAWKRAQKDKALQFHQNGFLNTAKNFQTKQTSIPNLKLELKARPMACEHCSKVASTIEIEAYLNAQLLPLNSCTELQRTRGYGCLSILPHSDDWL